MSKKPAVVVLPQLSEHWHPPGCDCEPAVPYVRVSKVGTRAEVISPDLQVRSMETYARANKIRLLEPVCDIDKSGRTFRKRSVDALITDIKQGKYRRILLWKWSRWARNRDESGAYLARVVEAGGRVDSATEDFDQSTATGRFTVGMFQQMDQLHSDLASETWHSVHDRRREAGLPHGGRPRFGYRYTDDKKYVIDETTSPILRKAYATYIAKGGTYSKVLTEFQRVGIKTTRGNDWTEQSIARMMDTGFAAGLIRERSTPTEVPSNSIHSYDVWREGSHEALIDEDTWGAYFDKRREVPDKPPRSQRAVHALSALLFCTECGRRLVTHYGGIGRTHQWQCAWRKAFHPKVAVSVNNRLALLAVREWVRDQFGSELPVDEYQQRAADELMREDTERRGERAEIQDKIDRLNRGLGTLLDLVESGDINKDEYRARKAKREHEVAALRKTLPPLPPEQRKPNYEALALLDSAWDDLAAEPAELRDALADLVSRIEVSPCSQTSTRRSASDRVIPIGVWEEPTLEVWRERFA